MEDTVIKSATPAHIRTQAGVVAEWDEEAGEGYIIPEEEQEAFEMVRVLRRDIQWHDSRRLFPGQFLQFQTVRPDEAPFEINEDEEAPFALRVRSPEVIFSLREAYASTDPLNPDTREYFALPSEGEASGEARGLSPQPTSERTGDVTPREDIGFAVAEHEELSYIPGTGLRRPFPMVVPILVGSAGCTEHGLKVLH